MNKPEKWTIDRLQKENIGRAVMWVSPSVARYVSEELQFGRIDSLKQDLENIDTLIVIGGGTMIDRAKHFAGKLFPEIRLVAIPSIWGSGAEASPIAVIEDENGKHFEMGEHLLPDVRIEWPKLAESIPRDLAIAGCADAWTHAVEGFLSPLADPNIRREIASEMKIMLQIGIKNDPQWFELSARVCFAQSKSSVGLVHGIAHTIELPARMAFPDRKIGHARICASFLLPVLDFNVNASGKVRSLFEDYDVDYDLVVQTAKELFGGEIYGLLRPLVVEHWRAILRDPSTRTNCALVRPGSLTHFEKSTFA